MPWSSAFQPPGCRNHLALLSSFSNEGFLRCGPRPLLPLFPLTAGSARWQPHGSGAEAGAARSGPPAAAGGAARSGASSRGRALRPGSPREAHPRRGLSAARSVEPQTPVVRVRIRVCRPDPAEAGGVRPCRGGEHGEGGGARSLPPGGRQLTPPPTPRSREFLLPQPSNFPPALRLRDN